MCAAIDFAKIRGDSPEGQRGSFEELVCQLARREAPDPKTFRRIEGSGGDAGVECIHAASIGGLVGYQAKYYLKPRDIDWSAIDQSVATALAVYPNMVKIIVAVASGFTGRRRIKGDKVSEGAWGKWDAHVEMWQRKASLQGRSVEFLPWPADEIGIRLVPSKADGLRAYWFGEVELSREWFQKQIAIATSALDERYHPEDHVEVAIQSLFEFITRHPVCRLKLSERIATIKELQIPDEWWKKGSFAPPRKSLRTLGSALRNITDCELEIALPTWETWDIEKWGRLVKDAKQALNEIAGWAWKKEKSLDKPEDKVDRERMRNFIGDLNEFFDGIEQLSDLLEQPHLYAERTRTALIEGRAGTGKSHLLAHEAEVALRESRPVILILGQHLRNQDLWMQILARLGLSNISADGFLGALDAAAEASRIRGLILIDAINEGTGARLWRDEIGPFLKRISEHKNLACVVSCRSEYAEYVVPLQTLQNIARFEIRGFESPEEQAHAARVYLDKRSILRPVTPWLAPEFVNPLFLRSCCIALKQEGRHEFPRGMTGTKEIFAFYIRSVGRHLGTDRDGTDDLVASTKSSLRKIALKMAENRKDYLDRETAEEIAHKEFMKFSEPTDQTWLEVLLRNGLLRFDPDPSAAPNDPLCEPQEVVRFSFQRFQDHLMGEALLAGVKDIGIALEPDGPLAFIHTGKTPVWAWRGLIEVLSTQVPERFGVELVDILPGTAVSWWRNPIIRDGFSESVRWRAEPAFTDRTLHWYNQLLRADRTSMSLLIELSASPDHPWNAELIHRSLLRMKMPERDAFWSLAVNAATDDQSHPLNRLIDWCLATRDAGASRQTLWLCSLVLAWAFTSSSRPVRDRATKALTSVFLVEADIFARLLGGFLDVDDLYVMERILAAAYGACCIDQAKIRLKTYAAATAIHIFSQNPPENLLLRDYARGIMELASVKKAIPKKIDIRRCRPPYASPAPRLEVTEDALKNLADEAGDDAILRSCSGFIGDFGRDRIEPSVNKFVDVELQKWPPYTSREKFEKFEEDVIRNSLDRTEAFEQLRKTLYPRADELIQMLQPGAEPEKPRRNQGKSPILQIVEAEKAFLALLSPEEKRRYQSEARPWLNIGPTRKRKEPEHIDVNGAKHWVAKRAYEFGWTGKLFPNEYAKHLGHDSDYPRIERIGKKYQWLALSQLLCQLADNYWIGGDNGDSTRKYDNPTDLWFLRNIDPTVMPQSIAAADLTQKYSWAFAPTIMISKCPEDEVLQWPFQSNPAGSIRSIMHRTDPEGQKWTTLYDHQAVTIFLEGRRSGLQGVRQQEFRLMYCALVDQSDSKRLLDWLKLNKRVPGIEWHPPEETDEAYLLEAPWRHTWPQTLWSSGQCMFPRNLKIAHPVCEYSWESHLDGSLPSGAHSYLPSPWLSQALGLKANFLNHSTYHDARSNLRFIGLRLEPRGSSALICSDTLDDYLTKHHMDCIWAFIGERVSSLGGNNDNSSWRRTEGICWVDKGKIHTMAWNEDGTNQSGRESTKKAKERGSKTLRKSNP